MSRSAPHTLPLVEPEALHLEAPNVGISTVRFRYTSLYHVTTGDACITQSNEGWIELHVYERGPITLDIDVTPRHYSPGTEHAPDVTGEGPRVRRLAQLNEGRRACAGNCCGTPCVPDVEQHRGLSRHVQCTEPLCF